MASRSGAASASNIDVEKTTLGRALKSRRLVVPPFQREYSWEHKRVAKLFSDFKAAMTRGQDSYFLGTVVFQATNPPGVIDGQQRLATTCVFLAAVRDKYLELGANDEAKSITEDFLFTYDRRTKEWLPRLLLNIDDRGYFKANVLLQPSERKPTVERREVHSHRLIDDAFTIAREWVEKITSVAPSAARKVEELNVWVDFIEERAVVVALTPPNLSQANQMFMTMNDRAQRTLQSDLIKSHLFQEVSQDEIEGPHITEAVAKWAMARKMVDTGAKTQADPVLGYLHRFCVVRDGPVTLDNLFDEIEGKVAGRNQALDFLNTMAAYAKPYRAAIGDHPDFWDGKGHQLKRMVEHCVKSMAVSFPIPLFLAVGVKFNDADIKLALRAIESWCARLMLTSAHRSGQAERGFGLLAHRVHKGEITSAEHLIRDAEFTLVPPDSRFQEKFRARTLAKGRQARYVLLELEAQIRAEGGDPFATAVDEPDRLNLEHVLPMGKEWAASYTKFTVDERDACVSKIGNLVLLKKDVNGALGHSPFSAKLPALAGSNIKTTAVVANFAENGEWTPKAIDERQVWLSELALKRWPLFGPTIKAKTKRNRR